MGLLLHELTSILDTASRHTRRRALFVLSSLLNKLIADERISGSQVKRNRVAVMFFPLLNIIIARMTRLELTPPAGASAASPPPTSTAAPSPVPQTPMTPGTPGTPVAPVLSAPAAPVGEGDGSYAVLEKRILLACFLQVLNNIDVKYVPPFTLFLLIPVPGGCTSGLRGSTCRHSTRSLRFFPFALTTLPCALPQLLLTND